MTPDTLLILILATYSMAYLLTKERAPFDVLAKLRARTTLGGLLSCLYCAGFWCAILCYVLMQTAAAPLVYVFAVRGGMQLAHRYTGGDMVQ